MKLWILSVTAGILLGVGWAVFLDSSDDTPDKVESAENDNRFRVLQSMSPAVNRDSLLSVTASLDEIGPISSIVIAQKGDLVTEEYFGRMNAGRTHNIKSASKSILSILVGIAIDKGYLKGVDQPIGEFFPKYFKSNPDSLKEAITIGDLLTMRSGLTSTSRSRYGRWVISDNWIEYKLSRPMSGHPGIDRDYSTGNTHLLSVILTRASGMSTRAFANRYLFNPMDIRLGGWDRDPQGYYMGGNNMALRPRDMVKIGELMMNMGIYNGEQLVSPEWVVESVKPVTGRRPGVINYGYLWFRRESAGLETVYAYGNGGQYILIIPEIEAIIAVTTRNGASGTRSYRRELFRVIDSAIVPGLYTLYKPA
ncbi:serine hydrolase domain-containing protein [Rhodohalobacter sp. 8-1]|uniref:serine hydrolase domain-containing protein n=1 Tax=Rhodohalobacter sp. 8-1 TaxID=3131972 RepID=UPI0030EDB1C0